MVEVNLKIPAKETKAAVDAYNEGKEKEFKWHVKYDKPTVKKEANGVTLEKDRLKVVLSESDISKIKAL